jgi:hypothetical protein
MCIMPIYRISTLFSGLVERVNEMRYANRQNAFDREAAHEAIQNRINANLPNPKPPERDLENNRRSPRCHQRRRTRPRPPSPSW